MCTASAPASAPQRPLFEILYTSILAHMLVVYKCLSVCICLAFGFSILPSTQIASALSV